MGWANNDSIIKKYANGGYASSVYGTQDLTRDLLQTGLGTQVEKQLLGERTEDVKTDFSERKQKELEEAVEAANKKASKYGKWGKGLGFLSNFIPGWGKFLKMGIDTATAGKQKDIFEKLAGKGVGLEGTFLEDLGKDFTSGYEKMAEQFDPLMAGIQSIASSYISEGVSKTVDKWDPTKGAQTVEEGIKDFKIPEGADYTVEDLQRVGDYTAKDWAMDETIDPEALEAYKDFAKDFKPGEMIQEEKLYGDMTFQERLKHTLPEFTKGDPKGNLTELIAQYQDKGPLIAELLAEADKGEDSIENLFRGYGY